MAGVRYVLHARPMRVVLVRTLASGLAGASVVALTPLVARNLLGGGAGAYGLLLGAHGVGAVVGAFLIAPARERMNPEAVVRRCALVTGLAIGVVGLSRNLPLTCLALVVAGMAWMLMIAMFNVAVQLSAPRWVTARALACFGTAITGGIAFGAWGWGAVAGELGVGAAMGVSGLAVALTPLLGLRMPMPRVVAGDAGASVARPAPDVALALTPRSGPIVVEIGYRVDPARARAFHEAMQKLRGARLRSGGFGWSLARDIADPAAWTERYNCPTWGDYLRQRSRATQADDEAQARANAFQTEGVEIRVQRRLERPFGSVRSSAETPDHGDETIGLYPH